MADPFDYLRYPRDPLPKAYPFWVDPTTPTRPAALSLAPLFANGENGFLFYPTSDLTRLFLLSNGSTGNVVSDPDPAGLALDNHSWGNGVSLTTILAAQTELLVPGSYILAAVATSTAVESPAGTLTLFYDGTHAASGRQTIPTVAGQTYRLTVNIDTSVWLFVGTTGGGNEIINDSSGGAAGAYSVMFVAQTATTSIKFQRNVAGTAVVSAISCKLIPGNHALQATTTKRPLWKTTNDKTSLLFDGVDDTLVSPFIPTAATTLAVAFKPTAASVDIMGGGVTATNKRAIIGLSPAGFTSVGWGSDTAGPSLGGPDLRNVNHVIVATMDSSTKDAWLDGLLLSSTTANGSCDGTGGGIALGAFNNNGSISAPMPGNIYAALAMNRRVTPAEVALITSVFTAAYQ